MNDNYELKLYGGLFAVLMVIALIAFGIYRSTATEAVFTVERLERVAENGGGRYLIFTADGEVLENDDSWAFLKFDSSDIYGRMDEGETYKATVAGWRIRFLSMYRNVIELEEPTP